MTKTTLIALMLVLVAAAAGAVFMLRSEPATGAGSAPELALAETSDADVVVYKSPTCGCCGGWVDHMEAEGYAVETRDVSYEVLARAKQEHGVPEDLGSCHTSLIGGYTVEGHVPAHVIERLLRERPDIRGIAVPGMPIGSPGMEGPNPQPYDVIAIGRDGSRAVFESVYPSGVSRDAR